MATKTISPQLLADRISAGGTVDLIDVRTPVEFREVHIAGARNVPLDRLDPEALQRERNGASEPPLYVVCRTGGRAEQACKQLSEAGIAEVVNVEGGTLACEAAGLSVVRGKRAISLERQVRIAAGALVFTGAALGYLLHPYWIGLSGFVGAGLMFAGITDTCAMGMLIAKMPWNQISQNSTTPSSNT